jgi:hypothetical protein
MMSPRQQLDWESAVIATVIWGIAIAGSAVIIFTLM